MVSEPRAWWQKNKRRLFIAGFVITLSLIIMFVLTAYRFGWGWTGLSGFQQTTISTEVNISPQKKVTVTEGDQPAKNLWDFLGVLAIPVVVGLGVAWFTTKFNEQQSQTEHKIAADNQSEEALQAYIDKMSALLLDKDNPLPKSEQESEVREIARARSLSLLRRLDADSERTQRKRTVLQMLYESRLIDKSKPIVDLRGADLSGADLSEISLRGADLRGTNLSGANLSGTILSGAILNGADLNKADLSKADLSFANLNRAILNGADLSGVEMNGVELDVLNLSGAKLSGAKMNKINLEGVNLSGADLSGTYLGGANLSGANLGGTNLSGARLSGADLRGADLRGARLSGAKLSRALVIAEQLVTVESLRGTIMPDESIHP